MVDVTRNGLSVHCTGGFGADEVGQEEANVENPGVKSKEVGLDSDVGPGAKEH